MADVIDFQKYKDGEEQAYQAATIIVNEVSGDIDTKEVVKTHKKIPMKYISRLLFCLDYVIDNADMRDDDIQQLIDYSDALSDVMSEQMEKLGINIVDEEE